MFLNHSMADISLNSIYMYIFPFLIYIHIIILFTKSDPFSKRGYCAWRFMKKDGGWSRSKLWKFSKIMEFFSLSGGGTGRPLPLNSPFPVDTSRHILIFSGKKTNPPLSNTLSVTVKTLSRCLGGLVYVLLFLQTSGSRLLHTLPRHQLYKMMRNDILS